MWVSAVSGVPLFDAGAKYNSGTGWPSFFQPVDPTHIIERVDPKDMGKPKFLWRVEVLDRKSGTHLGHVFNGAVLVGGGCSMGVPCMSVGVEVVGGGVMQLQ